MKLIVAFCKNRGIGFNNNIPWRLTADIRRFRKVTVGNGSNAVIMGRNTWDSLPENYRPLPKRANIVLTSKVDIYSRRFGDTGTTFVSSIGEAQDFCEKEGFEDTWVIGGEKIYKSFLKKNLITDIYTTQLKKSLRCDAFFPEIPDHFRLQGISPKTAPSQKDGRHEYIFATYRHKYAYNDFSLVKF
jgi:dihydrofolate reductase